MKNRNAEPIPNSKSIIITAAICLFFLSATVLFGNYVQNLREAKTFTDLTNTKKKPANHDYVTASDGKRILEEYAELYNTNQDFIGWLEIEGTVINYPVMYTPHDEEYYINRDFYGKSSSNGTLFVDADCTFNPVSDNIIIYGHNKSNGSMFSGLLNYRNKDFYRNNRIIRFDTIYGKGSYEIIAVFYSRVYRKSDNVFKFYNFIDAASKEEFDTFIRNIKALSIHDTGVEAEYGDKLITLCTCTNEGNNGRFVLVAKKVAYEPFNPNP